jgi:hypothetical protein
MLRRMRRIAVSLGATVSLAVASAPTDAVENYGYERYCGGYGGQHWCWYWCYGGSQECYGSGHYDHESHGGRIDSGDYKPADHECYGADWADDHGGPGRGGYGGGRNDDSRGHSGDYKPADHSAMAPIGAMTTVAPAAEVTAAGRRTITAATAGITSQPANRVCRLRAVAIWDASNGGQRCYGWSAHHRAARNPRRIAHRRA